MAGLALGVLVAHAATNDAPRTETRQAPPAPVFELADLDGEFVSIKKFEQPALIVMFWATWDHPSQRQASILNAIRNRLGTNQVEVIGISVDTNDAAQVKEFVTANKIQFPVLRYDSDVVAQFGGITDIPTLFVIDRNRNIYNRYIGLTPGAAVAADVELLQKPYATSGP